PLALYLPCIIWRTFLRLLRLEELCSPGCPETIAEVFFSKESIKYHRTVYERKTAPMAKIGFVGNDVEGQKMRRLGGWGGELRAWLDDVERVNRCARSESAGGFRVDGAAPYLGN
ncbi:hypothetical protein K438DRAFT_1607480, partial [Mycena galopus ATCC 62051]